nr:MAG TPA: Transcriptional regulator PadR-like family [Caudoviricetes sp.]DAV44294.1 MAG TPA: Transcriptional regulator PadR-like family [Caudoviricetes sp.]
MLDKGLIRKIPQIPLSESPEPCSIFYVLTEKGKVFNKI